MAALAEVFVELVLETSQFERALAQAREALEGLGPLETAAPRRELAASGSSGGAGAGRRVAGEEERRPFSPGEAGTERELDAARNRLLAEIAAGVAQLVRLGQQPQTAVLG